jgi:hypothetical protein
MVNSSTLQPFIQIYGLFIGDFKSEYFNKNIESVIKKKRKNVNKRKNFDFIEIIIYERL